MKVLLLTLLFFVAALNVKANSSKTTDTPYVSVKGLNRFAGIWEYQQGDETFRIVLVVKKNYIKGTNTFMDFVEGYHEYLKNAEMVQNGKKEAPTLKGGAYYYDFEKKESSNNSIEFTFIDKKRAEREYCRITLLPGNKLKWSLKNPEAKRFLLPGQKMPNRDFHVPNDIILTKVN